MGGGRHRHPVVVYPREGAEFGRAVAFVDATFALALTLLVTTLAVDDDPRAAWGSLDGLGDAIGGQLLAFAISFAVIAGYWMAHHRLLAGFAAIDRPTIVVNLVLVATVVILPFSTSSVGDPAVEGLALPVVFLAVNVVLTTILQTAVYLTAVARDLFAVRPTREQARWWAAASLAPAVVFLVSIPIAYAEPWAAELTWLAVIPLVAVLHRRLPPGAEDPGQEPGPPGGAA